MARSGRRGLLAFPLALVLGAAVLPLAKGSVDASLAGQARAALVGAGVNGVSVTSHWAGLTLSGPAERRAEALAALDAMPDRDAVDTVVYVLPSAAAGTGPPGTVRPTVVVDVGLTVSGSGDQRVVEIEGTVAGEGQYTALLSAVKVAAPDALLEDDVVIAEGAETDQVRVAFPLFLRAVGPAATGLATGEICLDEQGLTIDGTTSTQAVAVELSAVAAEAGDLGLAVTGAVKGPVDLLREQLAGVDGLGKLSFEGGSEQLTKASRRTLSTAAGILRDVPDGVVVEIRGYTDNRGDPGLNRRLSRRRAAAVRDYLVDKGVRARRLRAVGLGEKDPVRSNDTASGRAANRRIEFVVKES